LRPKYIHILYLYICSSLFGTLAAQELHLEILTENPSDSLVIANYDYLDIHPNFNSLKTTIDSIPFQLQTQGYLDATVRNFNQINDTLFQSTVYAGPLWKKVIITYASEDFNDKDFFNLGYKPKNNTFEISIENLERFLIALSKSKSEKGHPFASIRLAGLEKQEDGSVTAKLVLNNREARTIDDWVIKGYEKFPVSFLRYYAGVRRGRLFQKEKLLVQNERIDQLGFVKTIKPPEALFKSDSTVVYFYLEKTNHNLFDGILGFATDEETQKLVLNGYLSLDLNNNLNFGEQLKIEYKADGREQQNFTAFMKLPYLFKSPIGLSAELKLFKRDSTFSTAEQQFRIFYQANPTISIYSGYKHYESSNLLEEIQVGSTVEDYASNYILAGSAYIRNQNNLFFREKTNISIETEIGQRTQSEKSEPQFRISGKAHHIFSLNLNNSIYIGNQTSYLDSDSYLTNELFRFGGINNLRGFNENSLDASLYSVLNTEYRYQFNNGIYVHSVIDIAYLENEITQTEEQLYGLGFGLGLNTKSGILRLVLANGFSDSSNPDIGSTKVHLSFSAVF